MALVVTLMVIMVMVMVIDMIGHGDIIGGGGYGIDGDTNTKLW